MAVTTDWVVTEDGARRLPPHLKRGSIRRTFLRLLSLAILVGLGYVAFRFGPDLLAAYRAGFFERKELQKYEGDSMSNLRAQYTAMMLYSESEGQFPYANGWMDAIGPYLKTADLKQGEAEKKLVHPRYRGETDKFGYAMADDCQAKYPKDIKSPDKTLLIFESKDTARNAHGKASDLLPYGKAPAVTVSGAIMK